MGYHIIQCGPNCEVPVTRSLDLYGIPYAWFRIRRKVIHRGKLSHRIAPLFPGYIFIICRYLFQKIERLTGVRGFVRFGGEVEYVPDAVVDWLRVRAGPSGILNEDALPFAEGDAVTVKFGGQPTAGVFRSYLTPVRAAVDVMCMGREVSLTVRLGDLRSAG